MAKLTEEEQAMLAELQARAEAPDEDPDDNMPVGIQISDPEGNSKTITIPYKKAKPWLKKQGIDLDEVLEEANLNPEGEEGEEGEEVEGEEEEEEDPEDLEESMKKRPRRTNPAAKKAAPAKAKALVSETTGKSYWRKQA